MDLDRGDKKYTQNFGGATFGKQSHRAAETG
jgi:hypothetical protein